LDDVQIRIINSLSECPGALNLFTRYSKYFAIPGEDIHTALEWLINDKGVHFYAIYRNGAVEGLIWLSNFKICTAEIEGICERGIASKYSRETFKKIMDFYPDILKFKAYVDKDNRACRIFLNKAGFKKIALMESETITQGKVTSQWLYEFRRNVKCQAED
jgi:RimJ/RimL family protein N-acetyltransferase